MIFKNLVPLSIYCNGIFMLILQDFIIKTQRRNRTCTWGKLLYPF